MGRTATFVAVMLWRGLDGTAQVRARAVVVRTSRISGANVFVRQPKLCVFEPFDMALAFFPASLADVEKQTVTGAIRTPMAIRLRSM
jgi:hypothetical protein